MIIREIHSKLSVKMLRPFLLYLPIVGIYVAFKYTNDTIGKSLSHFLLSAVVHASYIGILLYLNFR